MLRFCFGLQFMWYYPLYWSVILFEPKSTLCTNRKYRLNKRQCKRKYSSSVQSTLVEVIVGKEFQSKYLHFASWQFGTYLMLFTPLNTGNYQPHSFFTTVKFINFNKLFWNWIFLFCPIFVFNLLFLFDIFLLFFPEKVRIFNLLVHLVFYSVTNNAQSQINEIHLSEAKQLSCCNSCRGGTQLQLWEMSAELGSSKTL